MNNVWNAGNYLLEDYFIHYKALQCSNCALKIDLKGCLKAFKQLQILVVLFIAFLHITWAIIFNMGISVSAERTSVIMEQN